MVTHTFLKMVNHMSLLFKCSRLSIHPEGHKKICQGFSNFFPSNWNFFFTVVSSLVVLQQSIKNLTLVHSCPIPEILYCSWLLLFTIQFQMRSSKSFVQELLRSYQLPIILGIDALLPLFVWDIYLYKWSRLLVNMYIRQVLLNLKEMIIRGLSEL